MIPFLQEALEFIFRELSAEHYVKEEGIAATNQAVFFLVGRKAPRNHPRWHGEDCCVEQLVLVIKTVDGTFRSKVVKEFDITTSSSIRTLISKRSKDSTQIRVFDAYETSVFSVPAPEGNIFSVEDLKVHEIDPLSPDFLLNPA